MNRIIVVFRNPILLLLLFSFTFSDCSDKCEETTYMVYYEPVYSTSAEIKAAVKLEEPRPMSQIGRIYYKDGYIFINEAGEGIHIIDNRDPANPAQTAFLNIPGNFDLAIRGATLYADSFIDLVAFDLSDLTAIKEIKRIEGLFNNYQVMGMMVSSSKGILTDWKKMESVSVNTSECNAMVQPWGGVFYDMGIAVRTDMVGFMNTQNSKAAIAPVSSAAGIGGSMARFTINGNYLYGLDGANLDIVDVSVQATPIAKNEIPISWDAETLFPYKDKLFVGSRTGMYIFDLQAPVQPTLLSQYTHVRSCDPVVVEGDYAYVTLRSGSMCEGFTNQLEVIDITDLKQPALVSVYPMTNPFGLGIDQGTLFICDGPDGLKAYDARDVKNISGNQLAHYKDIKAIDVIPYKKVAMVIAEEGLFQYDYSDIKNIKLLSQLPIVNQ